MPNKSKTVVSSKEQLKELGKCLRSTKPDILTDAIKKVNLDFINTDNSVPTLLNNLRTNNVYIRDLHYLEARNYKISDFKVCRAFDSSS